MRKSILAAALTLALAASLPAMFMNASVQVPIDRVTANVETWIKDKPKDPQGYYVLGRIHAMAYAYGPNLTLWGAAGGRGRRGGAEPAAGADPFNGQLPGFAPYDSIQVQRREAAKTLTADDAKHLEASIANYAKAAELDPKSAFYELGLAWILQETGKNAATLPDAFAPLAVAKPTDAERASYDALIKKLGDNDSKTREEASTALAAAMPKPYAQLKALKSNDPEVTARAAALVQAYWNLQALDHYRKAYQINLAQDLQRRGNGPAADSQISAEAGEQILAILKENPQAAKENEAKEVAANVQKMRSGSMAMTPIIFAMPAPPAPNSPATPDLGDLTDSSKRVHFDLAADGIPRTWPWLKPTTALLVWDPAHSGKIADARQLFGSRTWYICFRDGYEALSTLDDNHDGTLTGNELQGIAAWLDKNSNGISDPGEVLTLEQSRISAINTRAVTDPNGVLSSGITFTDGRTVKSFDWVPTSITTESTQAPK